MTTLLVAGVGLFAPPATAVQDDIGRCLAWVGEQLPDIDIPLGSPTEHCVPNGVPPTGVTLEPTDGKVCNFFCSEEPVPFVESDPQGEYLIDPVHISIYRVGCDVLLPTGHTIFIVLAYDENTCPVGQMNCQAGCVAIINDEFGGVDDPNVDVGVFYVGPFPVCTQDHDLYVNGIFILGGPIVVPCD
jgi:hypothetical protein